MTFKGVGAEIIVGWENSGTIGYHGVDLKGHREVRACGYLY